MKVLITGNSGFIGSRLTDYLTDKGVEVIGLSRSISGNNKDQIQFDLLNTSNLSKLEELKDSGVLANIHSIIHTSSILATKDNNRDFSLLYDNLKITENTVSLAKLLSPVQFINLSSIAVYPNENGEFTEDKQVYIAKNFEGIYGLSKIASENLFDFFLLPDSINTINLRLSQVYGEGMREDRIYMIMKNELLRDNKITVWGDGERISNFLSIEKLCNTIEKLNLNPSVTGIFNLGQDNISYKELAQNIISKFGNSDSKLEFVSKGNRSMFKLNSSKLDKIIKSFEQD